MGDKFEKSSRRVLILAPTMRDAATVRSLLQDNGIEGDICRSIDEVCKGIESAGAGIVTEESLLADHLGCLRLSLEAQPYWSDFPIIVLTAADVEPPRIATNDAAVGHMTLLKRPVHLSTLLSSVRTALRDRDRQYAMRDHLLEREAQSAALLESEERLRYAYESGKLGAWELNSQTGQIACTESFKAIFGLKSDFKLTYDRMLECIVPDSRARVAGALERALKQESSFEIEYPIAHPDLTDCWVGMRGRAITISGQPATRMSGVCLDITSRKHAEAEREALVEGLRAGDRRKNEFLAMLAHELRNPLAPIRNAVQIIRMRGGECGMADHACGIIARQLAHFTRLVDDLLDVARLTQGKITLNKEYVDLALIVTQTAEDRREEFEAGGLMLSIDVDTAPVLVHGDPVRLTQVVSNLLGNAAKFTDAGGEVHVSLEREGQTARICVRDTGIGIESGMLEKLFEVFVQVDRSLDRSRGGLGLGLAVVKGLVEMHGGSVSVASAGQGRGSKFAIELPIVEASKSKLVAPAALSREPSKGFRILVVEDNRDSADSLRTLLELMGYEVSVAYSGTEGLDLAYRARPDVVVCDIGLPGMDGYCVAAALRKNSVTAHAHLIALTGYGHEDDRRKVLAAGFDDHITKPAEPAALLGLISRTAGR